VTPAAYTPPLPTLAPSPAPISTSPLSSMSYPSPQQAPTLSPSLNTTQSAYFPPVVMQAAPGPSTGLTWSTTGLNTAGLNTATEQQSQQGNFHNVYGGQVIHFHGVENFNNMTNAFSTLALSSPNAVSSNDATPTVSVEEKAQMQKLSLVFCKWCERCKSGMVYV
jgi:hypothetical protein